MSDLGSQLYTAPKPPRKSPSAHTIKLRGSNFSLHQPQSLANDFHGDQNDSQQASFRFSLAHELAAALQPRLRVPSLMSLASSLMKKQGVSRKKPSRKVKSNYQYHQQTLVLISSHPAAGRTWFNLISRDASGDLGLEVWGNIINILSASAREARATGRRKESTMGCR